MSANIAKYNKDELQAPAWMNAEFFTKVLRECENDAAIEVKDFKLTPASVMGDHYASVMFRAAVEYQQNGANESKSLIIKTMPEMEGNKKDMLSQSNIFETEIGMYTEVLPRFEEILRSLGDNTVLKARCLYHSLTPYKLIIFEDLVPLGYAVLRHRQGTLEEVKCAILKLAKLHAISHKLIKEEPDYFKEYLKSFMAMPAIRANDFITGGMQKFIAMLRTVPEFKEYIPYFEAIDVDMFDKCVASFSEYSKQPQDDALYVLCHGDFHSKNLMFKHNPGTGKFEDVMLLDFQISYVGPIVNDLMYAIYMLMDSELRKNHLDELWHYYFTNFIETLKKIGYEGQQLPKLVKFREQFVQHKHLEIYLLVTFLPMWYAFRDAKVDPDDVLHSAEMRAALYQNPEYIQELKLILPKYLHLGYLEN